MENINPFCGATDTPVLVTSILGDQNIPKIPQYQNIQISYERTDCNIAVCNALLSFTRHWPIFLCHVMSLKISQEPICVFYIRNKHKDNYVRQLICKIKTVALYIPDTRSRTVLRSLPEHRFATKLHKNEIILYLNIMNATMKGINSTNLKH